jgi:hypothetical protein
MPLSRLFRNIFRFRPFRMYRRGRPVVNHFLTDELLYRRYRREHILNGTILPSALQFPKNGENTGQSVNRSRFSRPEDARWTEREKLDGWGVFQFPISCLPHQVTCRDTERRFSFFAKHVPLKRNYAHSEIWCQDVPPQNAGYVLPTKLVKKELRAMIQKHSQVVIAAQL